MTQYVVRFETESEPYLPNEGRMYKQVRVVAEDEDDALEQAFVGYEMDSPEVIDIWEEDDGEGESNEFNQ